MKYGTLEETPCIQSAEELQVAIELLVDIPARVEALLAGLDEVQLRYKPKPEVFSMVENLLHLRDIEIEGYSKRLRRILAEDTPALPDIDGTRLAIERRYNEQPVAPALAGFSAARRENVALLRTVTPADLARKAELEKAGRITLAQLVQMWREHDAGHRAELAELRPELDKL